MALLEMQRYRCLVDGTRCARVLWCRSRDIGHCYDRPKYAGRQKSVTRCLIMSRSVICFRAGNDLLLLSAPTDNNAEACCNFKLPVNNARCGRLMADRPDLRRPAPTGGVQERRRTGGVQESLCRRAPDAARWPRAGPARGRV